MSVSTIKRRVRMMEHQKPAVRPMDDLHKQIITPKVGRKKTPSIFIADVRTAIETGETYHVDIPAEIKPATILSELDKAGKELGVKLKKWKREEKDLSPTELEAGVKPFVGFVVVAPLAETAPVTILRPNAA